MNLRRDLKTTTQRLVIRPYTVADFEAWKEAYLDRRPKQNEFDLDPFPSEKLNRSIFRKSLRLHKKARETDRLYVFGVFELRSKKCVGFVDIYIQARLDSQCANLGYVIHNQHWGRGYAKEATTAVVRLAFQTLKLHRLEAGVNPKNQASVDVAKAIGMRYEGKRRACNFENGLWRDLDVYSIVAEDLKMTSSPPTINTTLRDIL